MSTRVVAPMLLARVANHLRLERVAEHQVAAMLADEHDAWINDQLATLTDEQAVELRCAVTMLTGLLAQDRDRRRGIAIEPSIIWTNDPANAPEWARNVGLGRPAAEA